MQIIYIYIFFFAVASVVYMTSWTNVQQIQQEILTYGPVTAFMYVYKNFMGYKKGWYTCLYYNKGPESYGFS